MLPTQGEEEKEREELLMAMHDGVAIAFVKEKKADRGGGSILGRDHELAAGVGLLSLQVPFLLLRNAAQY